MVTDGHEEPTNQSDQSVVSQLERVYRILLDEQVELDVDSVQCLHSNLRDLYE